MKLVSSWAVLLACLLLISFTAFAQSDNSTVSGVITDPSGAGIPGAKVVLKNQLTGLTRETTTNESGNYTIPIIPAGTYTVTVEASGFKKLETKDNKVDPNVPANVSAQMQVGSLSETVEVTATVSALQTESGALGKLVEGRQIQDIQLNGRNPILLALLKPGVRSGTLLSSFTFAMTTGGLNINGSRTQDNLITFDGAVAVRTRANGTGIGAADLDTTAEVQILTASYGAEYGRSAGGQVRIVSKSGGPQFHGAVYEYLRNFKTDANSWTRNRDGYNAPSPLKFNQFGFSISGPVFIPKVWNRDRTKMFFTYSEEWAKRRTESSGSGTVPSLRMKTGDFGELLGSNIWYSTPQVIKDPQNNNQPFPNNVIPTSRLSANGIGLLKVYPDPNITPQGSTNWRAYAPVPLNQRKDSFGLDLLPTAKDNIRWRGLLYHYYEPNPFQTTFLLSTRYYDRPNQTTSLNWTHTFTPTLINETLITASRDQVFIGMTDTPQFDRTKYGINYPYVYPQGKDRPNKLPAVSIPNFSGYTGTPYPSKSTGPIYVLSNNVTKIVNNHSIKVGFLAEKSGQNDYDQINITGVPGGTDNQNGRFEFNNSRPGGTGVGIGDAALGLFNNYAEIGTRSYTPYRAWMLEWFAQDDWKVSSKLKFIYGVRHTIVNPYYSLWGNMTVFAPEYYDPAKAVRVDTKTGNPIAGSGDAYNGIVIPGSSWPDAAKGRVPIADSGEFNHKFTGGSRGYVKTDYGNFQPRMGIAYQINPKTVVRAGAGKFTTRIGVSDSVFLGGNPPLQPMVSIPTGSVDNPGGGSKASFALSVNTKNRVLHMPEAYSWNLTVEREIGFGTVIDASYVGRRGLYGQREKNINQPALGATLANPGINVNALRPFKGYGPIRATFDDSNSLYNSFQLGVNRRFRNGFSYGMAYTWSRCEDSGSAEKDVVPNAYDTSMLWGPCDYDTPHVAVINWIYELPFFRNSGSRLAKGIAGGWQITGVTQFQSGTPGTVQTSDDFAGIGSGSGAGGSMGYYWKYANYGQKPVYPKQFASGGANDPAQWVQVRDSSGTLLFTKPTPGTILTDRMRNYFRNPGVQNWNLGIFKEFAIKEQHALLLRIESFNWLNHPNWSNIASGNPTSTSFGKVTGKSSERNMQFSLRYRF